MPKPSQLYESEASLVREFVDLLFRHSLILKTCAVVEEFDYKSGRTDVLSLDENDELVAFEAKISDWRKAIHQAWRNSSFADRYYVVLPKDRSRSAIENRAEFERLGVGLCTVDREGIEIAIESASTSTEPLIPWLHKKAKLALQTDGHRSRA